MPIAGFTGQMCHAEAVAGGVYRLRSEFPDDVLQRLRLRSTGDGAVTLNLWDTAG
ncbi:hypothetical protein [Actinoplanes sp. NPDC026670]|uniref:hypothetical protein n=1 Tax=Actinoplanes sp. NPDC026670 TaxID=3154700 RepID=UPI0033D7B570